MTEAEYERIVGLWFDFCYCGGPKPDREDAKTKQHPTDCQYRIRVEKMVI